jgi:hypothetical protein
LQPFAKGLHWEQMNTPNRSTQLARVFLALILIPNPLWAFTNGQDARYVLGQPNFTSNASNTTRNGMTNPSNVEYDSDNQRLFVGDMSNCRVTIFDVSPGNIATGMNASYVLGQPDFTTTDCQARRNRTGSIGGLVYDHVRNRLFAADYENNRVVVWDIPLGGVTNGMAARFVLGQSTWNATGAALSQNRMNHPDNMGYDSVNDRLFVPEDKNNRVLVYDFSGGVKDAALNSYQLAANQLTSQMSYTAVYFAKNVNGNFKDVTFSVNNSAGAGQMSIVVAEFSGIDTTSPLDGYQSAKGTNATPNSGNVTPSGSGDLVIGVGTHDGNVITSSGSSFNMVGIATEDDITHQNLAMEYRLHSGASAISSNFDLSNSTSPWAQIVALFKANGGGSSVQLVQSAMNVDSSKTSLTASFPNNVTPGNLIVVAVSAWPGTAGIVNGMNASYVIGQPDFTTKTPLTTQNRTGYVDDAEYDEANQRLFVSESARVLVFNVAPGVIANGMNASYVIGQPNFTSSAYGVTQNQFSGIDGMGFDPLHNWLFTAEQPTNRVMIWDVNPATLANNQDAIGVLGQINYTSNVTATTQKGMNWPDEPKYDPINDRVFVADEHNNRILVYYGRSSCSKLDICGTLKSAEDNTTPLPGVPVQLLDSNGNLLATNKTDTDGSFSFYDSRVLVEGKNYYVSPVLQPSQSAVPLQWPVVDLPSYGARNNFKIHGSVGHVQVSGATSGSFILITKTDYNGTKPPAMNYASASDGSVMGSVAGTDGTATLPAPAGSSYYLTCWKAQPSGAQMTYTRTPTSGSSGPYILTAGQQIAVTCP